MEGRNEHQPLYGRRLLPHVLDDEAQVNPHRVFAAISRSNDLSDGFRDVYFAEMANAVNYMAHRLQTMFGSTLDREFETLTYIGSPDLRYNIVFYAAIKCGYKVMSRPLCLVSIPVFQHVTLGLFSVATESSHHQRFADGTDPVLQNTLH